MLKTESMDDDTGRTRGLTGIRLVDSLSIILPSHAMPFQSKQVSRLWKCWPAGSLLLWSDHQLCHAIKGEFLSVYKQVLTGKNWLEQLDKIHDLWGDPLQSEAFFPHSAALRCPVSLWKDTGLQIHMKWHKSIWKIVYEIPKRMLYLQAEKSESFFVRACEVMSNTLILRTWVHSTSAGRKQHWLSGSETFRFTVSCIVFCDHLQFMLSGFCTDSVQVTWRRFTSVSGLNRPASNTPGKLSSWQHEVSVLARVQGWLKSCLVYGSEENECKPVRLELFIWSECVEQLQNSPCCKIKLIPVCVCSSNEGYLSWEQIPYGASQ